TRAWPHVHVFAAAGVVLLFQLFQFALYDGTLGLNFLTSRQSKVTCRGGPKRKGSARAHRPDLPGASASIVDAERRARPSLQARGFVRLCSVFGVCHLTAEQMTPFDFIGGLSSDWARGTILRGPRGHSPRTGSGCAGPFWLAPSVRRGYRRGYGRK